MPIIGAHTAHAVNHTAHPVAISHIVASHHLFMIGSVAQNTHHTSHDLAISHCPAFCSHTLLNKLAHCRPVIHHLAHAINSHHRGAVNAICPHIFLASIWF